MCLKPGCRLEASQLDHGNDPQRLLGFTAPIAVRLLQLRHVVRTAPEVPALTAVDPLLVQLLAANFQLPVRTLTITQFWARVRIRNSEDISGESPMARPGGELCGKDGDICRIGWRAYAFSPLKIVGKDQLFAGTPAGESGPGAGGRDADERG